MVPKMASSVTSSSLEALKK
ncbi:hypothetical protein Goshw_007805 [Gossypium schwendimanii]|uniref:Uncharacterized protein n=2 Tax=Gossypium TaxID=3633 RepID=A0A7J9M1M3_GOSSC|nr:hypothetical protein [Gossypium schwendimanii]